MLPLSDDQPTQRFPAFTLLVIAANVAVFALWQLRIGVEESVDIGGLVPAMFLNSHWQPGVAHMISSAFMHAGWMHLIGNMWFLWIFGNNIEDATGHFQFLIFYLICGVCADYAYIVFFPHSMIPLVGASGAVSGILGAYLVLHPNAAITTLGPFFYLIKLPAWFFLLVWIGIQIVWQVASARAGSSLGGVAYMAHIGGFLAGLILIFFFKNNGDALDSGNRGS